MSETIESMVTITGAEYEGLRARVKELEEALVKAKNGLNSGIAQLDVITALRGGHPHDCDFCRMPYNENRQPVPEEGSLWACTECERKWRMTDRRYNVAERLFGDDKG